MSNQTKALELDVIKTQMEQCCSFTLGAKLISECEPSFNKLIIRRDNQLIREALKATIHYGPMPFNGIRDVNRYLSATMKGQIITPMECIYIADLIRGISGIRSYMSELEGEYEALHELTDSLQVFLPLKEQIERCFNDYGEVLDSASTRLMQIRRDLRRIDGEIMAAAQKFVATHANQVVDNIITTRNGRACILLKESYKNAYDGIIYGESASGQASYVEVNALIPLNNRKQNLINQEEEEIEAILQYVSSLIAEKAESLIASLDTCALLDSLFAKAIWGQRNNACVAELNENRTLMLGKARHPLIDPKVVVANTYRLDEPYRMLLITGPNTGGKTVSLKIIGLCVLMTYCGMPVLCDEATVPYFDNVFIDIGDDQSVVSSLSTFSAHLSKLADVTRYATSSSLALLDEIGSGTDPNEGESLAIAILNDLREKGTMTIATTHYNRLKNYGKRHDDILLASVQFDMEKLMPTYKFIEGLTGQSNAFNIARRYGLKETVIKYAEFLRRQNKTQEENLIEQLEQQVMENNRLQAELTEKLKQAEEKEASLNKELRNIEKIRERALDKAEAEAEKYLEEAKAEADMILDELKQRKDIKLHEVIELKHQLEKNELPEISEDRNEDIKVGSVVEIKNSHQIGKVIEIKKDQLIIQVNGLNMKARRNQVRLSDKKIVNKATTSVKIRQEVPRTAHLECNLIGMRVDEALETMDKFLDDARLANLKSVRIIHGDGTGALRKAVHQKLKGDHTIDSFRLGTPSEGSTGATVVVFKG